MTITLASDKKHYGRDEPVPLLMTVKNTTDQERTFQHNGNAYDRFLVQNDDVEIWDSRYMQATPQVITQETYAPGQARQFKVVWNQGVCSATSESGAGAIPDGTYTSFGTWSSGAWTGALP